VKRCGATPPWPGTTSGSPARWATRAWRWPATAPNCRSTRPAWPWPDSACIALGRALASAGLAHAALDISDGLAGDIGHILAASNVGATLDADALPAGPALATQERALRRRFTAAGGDDYELCFTAPPHNGAAIVAAAARSGTPVTRVGVVEAAPGLRFVDAGGHPLDLAAAGFDHFAGA
jgi:thiamine-monophosphate kinase